MLRSFHCVVFAYGVVFIAMIHLFPWGYQDVAITLEDSAKSPGQLIANQETKIADLFSKSAGLFSKSSEQEGKIAKMTTKIEALAAMLESEKNDDKGSLRQPQFKDEQASDMIAKQIAQKWDNANNKFASGGAWHQHPLVVQTYKQRLASGSSNFVDHLRKTYGVRSKCISIGCGDGGIELQMVEAGLCETMEGIDLSPVRVERANQAVPAELHGKVTFSVKNAEKDLEGKAYDLVLFTHALHHIFDLEAMSIAIRDRIMEPTNGILVLEEFVGANRYQFPQTHLDAMADLLKSLEAKYPNYVKRFCQNPLWDGNLFGRPNKKSIEEDDPSEAIRSSDIIAVLSQYFGLVEDVPLGGTFFQWIFHNVYNSLVDGTGQEIVQEMLDAEMRAIADHKVTSDYVYQVWKNQGI